ncbi:hypothetical protein [Streptomyces sp. NPDC049915]
MANRLVATVRDGRAATGDGTAHYPNRERPEAYLALLTGFLRSL